MEGVEDGEEPLGSKVLGVHGSWEDQVGFPTMWTSLGRREVLQRKVGKGREGKLRIRKSRRPVICHVRVIE